MSRGICCVLIVAVSCLVSAGCSKTAGATPDTVPAQIRHPDPTIRALHDEIARLKAEKMELEKEVRDLEADLAQAEAERDESRRERDELKAKTAQMDAEIAKLKAELDKLRRQIKSHPMEIRAMAEHGLRLRAENERLRKLCADAGIDPDEGKPDRWQKMFERLEVLITEQTALIRKLEADPDADDARQALARQNDILGEIRTELKVLREATKAFLAEKEDLRLAKETAERDKRKAENDLAVSRDEISKLRQELERLQQENR